MADAVRPAAAPQMMRSMVMAEAATAPEPIRTRTDFSALALFAASVPTDADGRARVPVKLPDSLTRYRVMAVAVEGARRFGSAEATIVARLPLMVRPSAPRFLNFGDRFELPVVVQNQTDGEMTVDVAVGPATLRSRPVPAAASWWRRTTAPRCASRWRRCARARRASRWAPPPGPRPTRPRWSCRCGPRPRPRPSPRTGRSTRAASCNP